MKQLYLPFLLFVLAGCAWPYRPFDREFRPAEQEKTLKLKHGMDRRSALAAFSKYTRAQPGSSGYCGSSKFTFDPGTLLNVGDSGFSLKAYKRGQLVSSEEVGGVTRDTYRKVTYEEVRKFAQLSRVRVTHVATAYANCVKPARNEVMLSLQYGTAETDGIMVAPASLDELLAALMVLAPQARYTED